MTRDVIRTETGPAAIGPYSQAIRFASGRMVFVSGQVPIDPATGTLVPGGIREQTRRAIANLEAILVAAGASLTSVVKTTVFLADLGDFAEMNAVYSVFFSYSPPARSTVEAARLPRDVSVEIDCIAVI